VVVEQWDNVSGIEQPNRPLHRRHSSSKPASGRPRYPAAIQPGRRGMDEDSVWFCAPLSVDQWENFGGQQRVTTSAFDLTQVSRRLRGAREVTHSGEGGYSSVVPYVLRLNGGGAVAWLSQRGPRFLLGRTVRLAIPDPGREQLSNLHMSPAVAALSPMTIALDA